MSKRLIYRIENLPPSASGKDDIRYVLEHMIDFFLSISKLTSAFERFEPLKALSRYAFRIRTVNFELHRFEYQR